MSVETIKAELKEHLETMVSEGSINEGNYEDAHFHAFNEDYYIIGYHNASEWLKKHDLDAFEAVSTIQDYENENFGETNSDVSNSESVVNMIAYIYGHDVTPHGDTWEEFKENLEG